MLPRFQVIVTNRILSEHDLDIACAVLRIEQAAREGEVMRELLLDRLVTCDAPRLRKHISPEALEEIAAIQADRDRV